ncbi:MAG TPA: PKD domain-containing protein [Candidatus Bathyarchaeia archaeon]
MFDNFVIIAMENQNLPSVFGNSNAPFINSLLATGAYSTDYQGYGASGRSINGCSAGCYLALTAGSDLGKSDSYCPRASAPCLTVPNLIDSLTAAGLTWETYCEGGCPRGADHYPFLAYTNTYGSPNSFLGGSISPSDFIAAANSANPPNFLWFTPTDNHNMHDNSVSSGDAYIKSFLVGSGTISSPATGSLFASTLFQPGHRTLFVLWWDENNQPPELFYGSNVKKAYVSNTPAYDHYALLRLIENNWRLSSLTTNDGSATPMTEFFGSSTSLPISTSFTYLPSSPFANAVISFTGAAVGGTAPYAYSWNFGDGGSATGLTAAHSYATSGNYTTTLTVMDSASASAKSSQTVLVAPIPALRASFTFAAAQPWSGQSVVFTGTATGGLSPYTYGWNFGDGSSGSGQTPTYTYNTVGNFTVSLDVTDSLKASVITSQLIILPLQLQFATSIAFSPANPTVNSTIVFTCTPVNGVAPYTFNWSFGDNSNATGGTVSHIYNVTGTFTVLLNVTDNAGSVTRTSLSITVSTGPLVIGWGGVSLNEVGKFAASNPPSSVFPGEPASNMESVVMLMQSKGMNGIRVSWDPSCTTSPSPIGANYTAARALTAVQIASYYHFWIIFDYHGYTDPFTPATSACWLSFWAGVTNQFKDSYNQIIWEPENEPRYGFTGSACSGAISCVAVLSSQYQIFINQTRAQGDTHWIIVENICSYGCGLDANGDGSLPGAVNGYPTVTDPAGHVFISLHSYLNNPILWTYNGADEYARGYYDTVLAGIAKTGWPALNTEGGADAFVGVGGPNATLTGSAGYNNITLRFIQTLTNLYDSAPTRIGYTWWTAGDWTNTPGAGSLGALQCSSKPQGWGCLLQNKPISPIPPRPPSGVTYTLSFQGYDYDGASEETLRLNDNLLATLPTSNNPQNAAVFRTFTLNITSLIMHGNNTLTLTHTQWDCGTVDSTKNVTITDPTGTVIFTDPTLRPLGCTQWITYSFSINNMSPAAAIFPAFNFTVSPALAQTGTPTATSGGTFLALSKNFTTNPTAPSRALLFQDMLATPL